VKVRIVLAAVVVVILCGTVVLANGFQRGAGFAAQVKASLAKVGIGRDAWPGLPEECWDASRACRTSIARIIQYPQTFHERRVQIDGFFIAGFEQAALFESDQISSWKVGSGIWINGPYYPESDTSASLIGTFKRGPAGHMDDYPGELVDVVRGSKASLPQTP
jgi:hypothetical protein